MKTFDVNLKRTIPATPDRVYDAWLDAKSPAGPWYGAARCILNPTVDGLFYFAVENEDGVFVHYGRFVTLERDKKIVHTWMSRPTHGYETTVTITLEPRGDATELKLRHAGLPDEESARQHEGGWDWIFSELLERMKK